MSNENNNFPWDSRESKYYAPGDDPDEDSEDYTDTEQNTETANREITSQYESASRDRGNRPEGSSEPSDKRARLDD